MDDPDDPFDHYYGKGRQEYAAGHYHQAEKSFFSARRAAKSECAKDDCRWWEGLCHAFVMAELDKSYGKAIDKRVFAVPT